MHRLLRLCVIVAMMAGCAGAPERHSVSSQVTPADEQFERASALAANGDFDAALYAIEACFEAGYATPSDVLVSDAFTPLLDDPVGRARVFELMRANAREHTITMMRPDEPGEPMILTVRVVGGVNEPPEPAEPPVVRAGVVVTLVQVNEAGFYQPWEQEGEWNPRHFGAAVTDENGTVVVRTIRPGHYAPEYESESEPAHAHYNIEHDGVLLRASEFFFDDDPRLVGDVRREAEAAGVPIATVVRGDDGVLHAEVVIPARGLR